MQVWGIDEMRRVSCPAAPLNMVSLHKVGLRRVAVDAGLAVSSNRLTDRDQGGLVELVLRVLKPDPVNTRFSGGWTQEAAASSQDGDCNSRNCQRGQFPHTSKATRGQEEVLHTTPGCT